MFPSLVQTVAAHRACSKEVVGIEIADYRFQGSLRAIRIYTETSTIGRQAVLRISDGLRPRGIDMLDAPVSGGPAGAREGTLAIMVAGAEGVGD